MEQSKRDALMAAQAPPQLEKKADVEEMSVKMAEHTNSFMKEARKALQDQTARIQSVEVAVLDMEDRLDSVKFLSV